MEGGWPSRSTRRMFQVFMGRVWPRRRQHSTKYRPITRNSQTWRPSRSIRPCLLWVRVSNR
ncbi:Uncharacterised protein [Bordetella pertussis]|nr:Uncharacterised protein [Bordetella pertussis]